MLIYRKPMAYYLNRLRSKDYFSFAGYSDAEWFCVFEHSIGEKTGLGQVLDSSTGKRLLDVLRRRQSTPDFLFAVPDCLWQLYFPQDITIGGRIDSYLHDKGIWIEAYERDMATDRLAQTAGLFPLIKRLKKTQTVVIGNKHLRGLDFLNYDHFIEISSPNLHLEPNGIEDAVASAKSYGKSAVYLISAGVSAALIIDRLHGEIPDSFFLDCGSIWDAFVGIGEQRGWRRELYENPTRLERWRHDNLFGKKES